MKKKKVLAIAIVVSVLLISTVYIVIAANPGQQENPLISLSYINDVLMPEIDKKIEENGGSGAGLKFKVVEVPENHFVFGNEGTEMILRGGSGVVASPYANQGLSDMTDGKDVVNDAVLELNHSYLVPRSDRRGIYVSTKSWVMIKGAYTLEKGK